MKLENNVFLSLAQGLENNKNLSRTTVNEPCEFPLGVNSAPSEYPVMPIRAEEYAIVQLKKITVFRNPYSFFNGSWEYAWLEQSDFRSSHNTDIYFGIENDLHVYASKRPHVLHDHNK